MGWPLSTGELLCSLAIPRHWYEPKFLNFLVYLLQAADPTLVPLLWDENSYQAKPTIGFYTWWASTFERFRWSSSLMGFNRDGLLKPAPGCQRAVTEAVALLEKKGYTVVPIQGPDINKVWHDICILHTYMHSIRKKISIVSMFQICYSSRWFDCSVGQFWVIWTGRPTKISTMTCMTQPWTG